MKFKSTKTKRALIGGILLVCLMFSSVIAERDVIDRIIVVVGNEVILASELANQVQLTALQRKLQIKTEDEAQQLQKEILDEMISDRLFLIAAREDTLIDVREEEIEMSLEDQITRISSNFGTQEEFLAALASEGITLRELKNKYRSDVKNQLLKQKFIQQKLSSVSVSKQEVIAFYGKYSDSIPSQPEAVRLAHILLGFKASAHVEDSVKILAEDLRRQVIEGADFAAISTNFSSPGAGANGGELGYLSRDDVVPEFARAAFALSVDDISGVVRSQFGYHIIKCEGQKGDKLKLRHILLAVEPSPADSQAVFKLSDSLLNEINNGGSFEQLAKTFSDDNETRPAGGELGWFALNQLPPEFASTMAGWQTPNEVRGPVTTAFGLHLIKLFEYKSERKFGIEDDFDRIKEMARQDKTGRYVDKLIEDIKQTTYISYNIEL